MKPSSECNHLTFMVEAHIDGQWMRLEGSYASTNDAITAALQLLPNGTRYQLIQLVYRVYLTGTVIKE